MRDGAFASGDEQVPEQHFREMIGCWHAGDVERMFRYIHPTATHEVNVDSRAFQRLVAGHGQTKARERFEFVEQRFEVVDCKIDSLRHNGDVLTSLISITYRHRCSGVELPTQIRLLATWQDGQFTRLQEFNDRRFVKAYLRLTGEI